MLNFDFYEKYPTWKCSSLSLLTSHLSRGYNTINTQAKKGFFFRFVEILPKTEAKLTMIFPLSSIIERNVLRSEAIAILPAKTALSAAGFAVLSCEDKKIEARSSDGRAAIPAEKRNESLNAAASSGDISCRSPLLNDWRPRPSVLS